jgi:hypothetical protein
MELPERTRQHKAESDSYAILLYKLRRIGIFRDMTENDYGIDFEIELVRGSRVTGNYFKAQVKSAQEDLVRISDGIPTIGGIKQTTLNYWCELSLRTHVIAYAVDLKSELIYVSRPLFWQATRLLTGDGKKKTIEFYPDKPAENVNWVTLLTLKGALSPQVRDELYAHAAALRELPAFLELYADVFHYDGWGEIPNPRVFQVFLETVGILAWEWLEQPSYPDADKQIRSQFAAGRRPGGAASEITNDEAGRVLKVLLPVLIQRLQEYKTRILAAPHYWYQRNPQYLQLVYETALPPDTNHETLLDWGYHFEERMRTPTLHFSVWINKQKQANAAASDDD